MPKQTFALICTVKDENENLIEWINFHLGIGFDKIFIIDHGSSNPILNFFQEQNINLRNDNKICLIKPELSWSQTERYDYVYKTQIKDSFDWFMALDLDEYLMIPDLNEFVLNYIDKIDFSAIGIHWKVFGSKHSKNIQRLDHYELYQHRLPDEDPINKHIKSLIKSSDFYGYLDPHYADTKFGTINTEMQPIYSAVTDHVSKNNVFVAHYYTRTYEEFLKKIKRGRGDGMGSRTIEEYEFFSTASIVEDKTHMGIIDKIKFKFEKSLKSIKEHSVSYESIHVYQIFFDYDSKIMIDPNAIPYDNTIANTNYYENHVIRNLYLQEKHRENCSYIGVLSWKFKDKTRLSIGDLKTFIVNDKNKVPVYIINPIEFLNVPCPYNKNTGFEAVYKLADFLDKNTNIFNFRLTDYNQWQTCWCNYWVVKPQMFELYLKKYLMPLMEILDMKNNYYGPLFYQELQSLLEPNIHYYGKIITPHTMLLEGLFGVFLHQENIKYKDITSIGYYKEF